MLHLTNCRACGSGDLSEVINLGEMPLAGDFREKGDVNRLYPLAVDLCGSCGLLQVRETIDHSVIFNPNYSYSSSTVPDLVRHFEAYADEVALPTGAGKLLLEVGCNDGVFLEPLRRKGFRVVGMDASENVALMARGKGLNVHANVFNRKSADELLNRYGHFDVITSSNVFAHNPDVHSFIDGVELLLDPVNGEFWVEVHSAHSLYEGLQWDCFYHEHCFYWTIHSLAHCLESHGLYLKSYKLTQMHGGALRAVFTRSKQLTVIEQPELTVIDWGQFSQRCLHSRELIQASVKHLPIRYAYGAAGRAVTLINWTGIASELEFVVDGSPLRFGKVIPNTAVPVISEEKFFQTIGVGEWCFVSAHNYLQGIRRKVEQHAGTGRVKFVIPLPYVTIQ